MSISRIALGLTDRLLRAAAALLAAVVGLYSAYALWDNARVYTAADDVRADMLRLKPDHGTDGGASFAELRAVNGDVRAWLTLDGTAIDIGHFIGRDGSVGSRHQRALICKFHSGNAPFAHALRPQTETKLPEL